MEATREDTEKTVDQEVESQNSFIEDTVPGTQTQGIISEYNPESLKNSEINNNNDTQIENNLLEEPKNHIDITEIRDTDNQLNTDSEIYNVNQDNLVEVETPKRKNLDENLLGFEKEDDLPGGSDKEIVVDNPHGLKRHADVVAVDLDKKIAVRDNMQSYMKDLVTKIRGLNNV